MLRKYLREERKVTPDKYNAEAAIRRIKGRISIATPKSPIVVFEENGVLYEFFLNTARSRTMVKDKSLNMIGAFHNEMHEAVINSRLTIQ